MQADDYDYIVSEIQQMMYGFGDNQRPLRESALLVEQIIRQQMRSLLRQCDDIASIYRESTTIGHEDILFLLRKDKVKLKRLLKYLHVKDAREEMSCSSKTQDQTKYKSSKLSRVQRCMNFLATIDQTGELSSLMEQNIFDAVKFERMLRLNILTSCMDQEQYIKYTKARQASFNKKDLIPIFKNRVLGNHVTRKQLTGLAQEILYYLAFETVAQIVDLSLLVKQDALTDSVQRLQPPLTYNGEYQNAEMANTFSTQIASNEDEFLILNQSRIRPEDIQEAIRRYFKQSGPFTSFSNVYESDLCQRLLCC